LHLVFAISRFFQRLRAIVSDPDIGGCQLQTLDGGDPCEPGWPI
jgi:hypothetical protein